ncbi:MAG: CDP-glucose 4,6-dehydratase [Chitinophagaceae bacterium]|nr:CDP-glucose 4,6-dehydratase [Chitinophagaceae bacterium]
MKLNSFYQNKKIFLTGHTGFKGSWLLCWLANLGAIVKGYSLAPENEGCLYNLVKDKLSFESEIADIRDKKNIEECIINFQPDIIFHLAAQPLVRKSYQIPAETFEVNVVGTCNILEAVNKLNKKCAVVIITTDKVYHNKELNYYYKEDDVLGGYDPYSASKAACEIAVNSFRSSFFNRSSYHQHQKSIITARAGNVIGGGDWSEDRIVPDIIRALKNNETIEVRNPKAIRPWQHVLEPLQGYLILGKLAYENYETVDDAYNFGPLVNDHLPVRDLVETAIKCWGTGGWKDISNSNQLHEAGLLMLDVNKAISKLNWQPKLNSKQAIEWTINWYKEGNSLEYTFQQINNYVSQ